MILQEKMKFPTLSLAVHAYQKCVWIPFGWSSNRKKGHQVYHITVKNWRAHPSFPTCEYSWIYPLRWQLGLPWRTVHHYKTIEQNTRHPSRTMSFALCCDSLWYFIPRFVVAGDHRNLDVSFLKSTWLYVIPSLVCTKFYFSFTIEITSNLYYFYCNIYLFHVDIACCYWAKKCLIKCIIVFNILYISLYWCSVGYRTTMNNPCLEGRWFINYS